MKRIFFGILGLVLFVACDSGTNIEADIEAIPVEVDVIRFDKIFGNASKEDLPSLKSEYPMFFPKQYPDSIWEARLVDSIQIQLNEAVLEVFPSEEQLEDDLIHLFQHIEYYFPQFKTPKVYTTTSDVDYRTKVIVADSLLIIELDTYLGADHPFYQGISRFLTKNMKASMVSQDIATAYSKKYILPPKTRTLLDQMVYFGKQLYLKDLWLPHTTDAEKIGYTEEEFQWAIENEEYIWRYFIENELLYSTDPKLAGRFINPAPFSKFNLEIDNESPGMIGRYMGWQIVRSYMDKTETDPKQLVSVPAEQLFRESKYKPKK